MIEIEHKFLLKTEEWKELADEKKLYQQAYISTQSDTTVRVRIVGEIACLTIKGIPTGELGISRTEFEYEIPIADARIMISECVDTPILEKYRYIIPYAGKIWEVDEFIGDNAGLVLAEIELSSEKEEFEIPSWIGKCVSEDRRYNNVSLTSNPYKHWR